MKALFISLLFIGLSAQAQESGFSFGPKVGLNISKLSGVDDQKFKAGFHIGGFADYRFNSSFSIRPELLYTTLGSKEKNTEPSVGFEDYIGKYDYLSLPIMARYHFSGVPGLSVAAGPYVSFLLSAKIKGESGNQSAEFDVKDVTKSLDFGVGAGAAYEFYKGIFAEIRGNFGLSNINDAPFGDEKPRHLNIQISAGYRFN